MANLFEAMFENTPPKSLTSGAQNIPSLPNWYQDYQKQLLKYSAQALPINPVLYGGNRQADLSDPNVAAQVEATFSPDEKAAFEGVRNMQGAWQPGMAQAGALTMAGAEGVPGMVGDYMSPYIQQVSDRLGALAQRNLSENLLPAISDTFVGAGQMQGTRQGEFTSRALRDTQESLLGQQAQLLNTGYQGALSAAQTDQARRLQAGQQMSDLAGAAQGYGLTDVAALQGVGQGISGKAQTGADIAYEQFVQQRDWPLRNIGALNAALRGTEVPYASNAYAVNPVGSYGASPLAYGMATAQLPYARRGGRVKDAPRGALRLIVNRAPYGVKEGVGELTHKRVGYGYGPQGALARAA